VQVFGDSHGNVVHLFERDCSLQRRHQKVIEEAPAPGMDAETREAVCGAAVRAAQAVNYENAGTIEFIADASEGLRADRIWFMEMNTRLQVEHPVTEEITGQDLVEWQLRVASGKKLPKTQGELAINGHAIEARLYAEDPRKGFLPSTGPLDVLALPGAVRVDTGVEEGDEISSFYDPMIAKLVSHRPTREEAAASLADAIEFLSVWPVRTNAGFLFRALSSSDFVAGNLSTSFIPERLDQLLPPIEAPPAAWKLAAINLGMHFDEQLGLDELQPWTALDGFRLNGDRMAPVAILCDGQMKIIDWWSGEGTGGGGRFADGSFVTTCDGQTFAFTLAERRGTGTTHGVHDGEIEAPMPGKVTAVEVAAGDKVEKGQRLLTLEAMKMEHALTAPFDGTVAELNATEGAQVTEGQLLVKVEAEKASSRT